jgi:GNAT superfamily N-acetyltransferase
MMLKKQRKQVTLRPMTQADIPLGMALKEQAGWNQTARDWEIILEASRGGNYVAVIGNKPVGTITTISYQARFSWLGMLLVHSDYRGQGIGTQLLKAAIAYAEQQGAIYLDATPAGKPLYQRLGFKEVSELIRMLRTGRESPSITVRALPQLGTISPEYIYDYDTPIFGADRRDILSCLYQNTPQYGFICNAVAQSQTYSPIIGYCLGRSGSQYEYIGPVVADSIQSAQKIVLTVLQVCGYGNVIMDVPTCNAHWVTWLTELGFVRLREYSRMILGSEHTFGQLEKQFAIAGPEFG